MKQRDTILLAHADSARRAELRGCFEDAYNLLEAENGEQALLLSQQNHNCIAAAVLDAGLEVLSTGEVLSRLGRLELLGEFPVLVLADGKDDLRAGEALEQGAADVVTGEWNARSLRRRVQNLAELYRYRQDLDQLAREQASNLERSHQGLVDALSSIIEYRRAESGGHSQRIRRFTQLLLEDVARTYPEYGLTARQVELIVSASVLHDIGKITIPDAILNKTEPLTEGEFALIQTHAENGCAILNNLFGAVDPEYLHYAYNICRYHHERWDGGGYPMGLKGEEIPICAQVVGLADAFEALITDRGYQSAYPYDSAANMIFNGQCGAFSPKLLACFDSQRDRLAEVGRMLADQPRSDAAIPAAGNRVKTPDAALDTLQMAQVKYLAMLRYADGTALELDFDNDVFHIIYNSNPEFSGLSMHSIDEVQQQCLARIHPEDLEQVRRQIDFCCRDFFAEKMRRYSFECRVYHAADSGYHLYRFTALRVDVENLQQRKAILIWKPVEHTLRETAPALPTSGADDSGVLYGLISTVLHCRSDRWMTITSQSDDLFSLIGYTRQEVGELFEDRLIRLIVQEDREPLRHQLSEQFQRGNTAQVEFRMLCRDGSEIWVLDHCRLVQEADGMEYFYHALVNNSKAKQTQQRLELALERTQLIINQTNDVIFEWNLRENSVTCSEKWEERFGYPVTYDPKQTGIPMVNYFHPDDTRELMEKVEKVRGGERTLETELRIVNARGRYLWNRIRATIQCSAQGEPTKVIGVIVDIDQIKRGTEALQEQAAQDALTGLLNKGACRRQVEEYLASASGSMSALLMIDLDNFKQVNDRFGHLFGDAVLTQVGGQIRRLFRSDDVVGRVGGDEFMVLLKNVPGLELVTSRCMRLVEMLGDVLRERVPEGMIACSVGVALCPEHGVSYQELYQKADQALYQAKGRGKNQYVFYDPSMLFSEAAETETTRIDSDEAESIVDSRLVNLIFRRLYEESDIEKAVGSVLQLLGEQLKVDRVYVYENNPENSIGENTFEWCGEGTPSIRDTNARLDFERDVPDWLNHFDEQGMFYCTDMQSFCRDLLPNPQAVLQTDGVQSSLQCLLRDSGVTRGFVGVDDRHDRRLWTRSEVELLQFLAEALSLFLLRKRAQDEAARQAEDLRGLLDDQSSWMYIIDPENYQIRFVNALARQAIPEAGDGAFCYQAIMGRDTPCEKCPARGTEPGKRQTAELSGTRFSPLVRAESTYIRWNGQDACLISCRSIEKTES